MYRKWIKRTKHLKDRKRESKESKITLEIELFILGIRNITEEFIDLVKKFPEWLDGKIKNLTKNGLIQRDIIGGLRIILVNCFVLLRNFT